MRTCTEIVRPDKKVKGKKRELAKALDPNYWMQSSPASLDKLIVIVKCYVSQVFEFVSPLNFSDGFK